MSRRSLLLLTVALLVLVEALQFKLKPRITPQQIKRATQAFRPAQLQGKIAPAFQLQQISGQKFTLADQVGKRVIVLNFFATWCEPCRHEMPEIERYVKAHANEPFVFLAIDCNESVAEAKQYMHELHLTFPVAVDSGPVQGLYGVTAYPTTVLIGVDGRVQFDMAGAISNADVAFNHLLAFNQKLIGTNLAISRDEYLREAMHGIPTGRVTVTVLSGRALRIAAQMPCPCGCDTRVRECGCQTARKIEADLARGKFSSRSDAQIMTALNRKYCMAGM